MNIPCLFLFSNFIAATFSAAVVPLSKIETAPDRWKLPEDTPEKNFTLKILGGAVCQELKDALQNSKSTVDDIKKAVRVNASAGYLYSIVTSKKKIAVSKKEFVGILTTEVAVVIEEYLTKRNKLLSEMKEIKEKVIEDKRKQLERSDSFFKKLSLSDKSKELDKACAKENDIYREFYGKLLKIRLFDMRIIQLLRFLEYMKSDDKFVIVSGIETAAETVRKEYEPTLAVKIDDAIRKIPKSPRALVKAFSRTFSNKKIS